MNLALNYLGLNLKKEKNIGIVAIIVVLSERVENVLSMWDLAFRLLATVVLIKFTSISLSIQRSLKQSTYFNTERTLYTLT